MADILLMVREKKTYGELYFQFFLLKHIFIFFW